MVNYIGGSILPNNLTNTIVIGSAAQTDTIYLNGTIVMPLNDLFGAFTSVSNGYVSQI